MRPVTSPHRRVRLLLQRLEDRTAPAVAIISAADPNMLSENAGGSVYPSVSRDGRFVAFVSAAVNLVDGVTDTNREYDLFLFDRTTGARTFVSHTTGSANIAAGVISNTSTAISDDLRFIAYNSRAPGASSGSNVYLYDRQSGATTLVSHGAGSRGVPASGDSYPPVLSRGK